MTYGPADVGRALVRALRNFRRDRCLDQAAVVAFYSLLSLGPLIYLTGTLLRASFHGTAPLQQALLRLSPFLPPEAASALAQLIDREIDLHRGLVVVALPALLWVASSGFHALERAVNVAYATHRHRAVRARLRSFAVMVGSLSFLGASLALHAMLLRVDRLRESLQLPAAPSPLIAALSHGLLLVVAFGGFAVCFRLLPRCPSSWPSALGGAALALPLWDAARQLFGGLLQRSPAFGLLTGTMSAIVAFQLWIYASVAVGLLGAEFAALLAGRRGPGPRRGGAERAVEGTAASDEEPGRVGLTLPPAGTMFRDGHRFCGRSEGKRLESGELTDGALQLFDA